MSPLYLYALVGVAPARPLPRGMSGERLRLVDCDGVLAAVGEMGAAPPLEPDALRGHDAAVRALSGDAGLLPARFGSVLRDEDELRAALRPRAAALRSALERVRGCEQMTVRIASSAEDGRKERTGTGTGTGTGMGTATETDTDTETEAGQGPGTRYLARRRAERESARAIPEVARLLDAVADLVREERLESHRRPPLIASAYHLVARGSLEAYRARLEAAVAREGDLHVTVSGPWPPYAFAPGELG